MTQEILKYLRGLLFIRLLFHHTTANRGCAIENNNLKRLYPH